MMQDKDLGTGEQLREWMRLGKKSLQKNRNCRKERDKHRHRNVYDGIIVCGRAMARCEDQPRAAVYTGSYDSVQAKV